MNRVNRKTFLRKMLLAGLGSSILPGFLRATPSPQAIPVHGTIPIPGAVMDPDPFFQPNAYGIVDLHCHPSLKMYLWGRHLWRRHTAGSGINAIDLQDDLHQLTSGSLPDQPGIGFVKGIVVAHYLVEAAAEKQWDTLKHLYPWISRLFRRLANKLEHEDWSNFTQINQMIDEMEAQVYETNQWQNAVSFVVAKSYAEFDQAIQDRKLPVAHAIEGAHALGRAKPISAKRKAFLSGEEKRRDPGLADLDKYIRNLEVLKGRGVCMMTLAHFFANDIAFCVEGISPDEKDSIGMKSTYVDIPPPNPEPTDHFYDKPLTPIGEAVVRWMLKNGMIVDLTHSTPAIRAQVFKINLQNRDAGEKFRPIVFTHTGYDEVFNRRGFNKYPGYAHYCVTEGEIDLVSGCKGTIGVIPDTFWLAGGDTHLRKKGLPPKLFRNAIPYMVETIIAINKKTRLKDYSNISIGTDFDGYADESQDLYVASQMGSLINALRAAGVAEDDVIKITSQNARRVLGDGWG